MKMLRPSSSKYFNPRSPCGERPPPDHAYTMRLCLNFNPRSPCGERPRSRIAGPSRLQISIHAPLAGSDCGAARSRGHLSHFNPRSPCGERRCSAANTELSAFSLDFNRRSPSAGSDAPVAARGPHVNAVFRSDAPLAGSDCGNRQTPRAPEPRRTAHSPGRAARSSDGRKVYVLASGRAIMPPLSGATPAGKRWALPSSSRTAFPRDCVLL